MSHSMDQPMKILAVDDDDSIRDLLTIQLRRHGYDVLTAADGEEALEKAPAADFVVLDLMLPKLDGYEVCRRLKSVEKTKNIPIIISFLFYTLMFRLYA